MTRVAGIVIAAVVLAAPATVAGQERPDLSGRWVDETVEPAAAGGRAGGVGAGQARGRGAGPGRGRGRGTLGSGWGPDITIAQEGNRLTVQYVRFSRGDMQPPIIYQFTLDGSESRNRLLLGWGVEEPVSHARWDGNRLVITTQHSSPPPATGVPAAYMTTQVLSLESAATLIVETTRPGAMGGETTVTRTTYTKR